MFRFFKMLCAYRDGGKMLKLYERALDAANRYVAIKLGPGNAKIASAMVNDILSEDALKGNGVEDFRAKNRQIIEQKAKQLLEDDPVFRELMGHTLWVKWALDKAHDRNIAISNLEKSWAHRLYSASYPLMPIKDYSTLVERFEHQTTIEIGRYFEAHSKGRRT